jgi:hypothetical protein
MVLFRTHWSTAEQFQNMYVAYALYKLLVYFTHFVVIN